MPDAQQTGGPEAPPRARGLRADARRNLRAILEAAAHLLADDPDASMQQVAAAAGVHRATLYRHFPAREDLLLAIHRLALEEGLRAIEAARPDEGNAADALVRVIGAIAAVGDRYRMTIGTRDFAEELGELRERSGALLIGLAERGRAEGSLRRDIDARWIIVATYYLLVGALGEVALGEMAPEDVAGRISSVLLDGVRAGG